MLIVIDKEIIAFSLEAVYQKEMDRPESGALRSTVHKNGSCKQKLH